MVGGPYWDDGQSGGKLSAPADPDDRKEYVVATANQLVSDLEQAERATAGWSKASLADALVDVAVSRCVSRLARTNLWGRDNQLLSGLLWQIAESYLIRGSLQRRAREKPLGYAGDYVMLTRLCERDCCTDPLGRAFDEFFQKQAAVMVVRSRTDGIAAAIAAHRIAQSAGEFRVASVGSGPAIDVARALATLPSELRRGIIVTLLDLDAEALAAAQARLAPLLPADQVIAVRDNLFRLGDKPGSAEPLAGADFLFCTGLFDYLPDEPAARLLGLFWNSLSPRGRMLVGNFAPHCPTRAFMEWIGNWYLLYRTPSQLAALAEQAGLPSEACQITAEHLGIDLFLDARRH